MPPIPISLYLCSYSYHTEQFNGLLATKNKFYEIYFKTVQKCVNHLVIIYEYFTFIEFLLIIEMFSYFRTISTQELRHIMSNLGEKMKVRKKRKSKIIYFYWRQIKYYCTRITRLMRWFFMQILMAMEKWIMMNGLLWWPQFKC